MQLGPAAPCQRPRWGAVAAYHVVHASFSQVLSYEVPGKERGGATANAAAQLMLAADAGDAPARAAPGATATGAAACSAAAALAAGAAKARTLGQAAAPGAPFLPHLSGPPLPPCEAERLAYVKESAILVGARTVSTHNQQAHACAHAADSICVLRAGARAAARAGRSPRREPAPARPPPP